MIITSSVTQSCPTLCNPMDCSTPGLPVHHRLLEFTQTHVHWVSDAIQPSHPWLSPSPLAFNLPQHQGLFTWVSSSHHYAKMQMWWQIWDVAGSRSVYYVVPYQLDGVHNNCFVLFFNICFIFGCIGSWSWHVNLSYPGSVVVVHRL